MLSAQEVAEKLHVNLSGLSGVEASHRLGLDGKNILPENKPRGYFLIFLDQFRSPIIYILLVASLVVFSMGEIVDGLVILTVLVINSIIGTIQEGKAQNTLNALKHFVETKAVVVRDGREISIPDSEVVSGDILVLKEGDKVPADARIIETQILKIDESALTGESVPVSKNTEVLKNEVANVVDEKNMVFRGTYVVGGGCRAVVVGTGLDTYIGKISKSLSQINTEVPLKKSIEKLSRVIIGAVFFVSILIFFIGLWYGFGVREMFTTVIAIAVSAIPEGLPVVVTLILATGVYRMGKKNALVKRLQAVEALGQANIIAVDKTGTLTFNKMHVARFWTDHKYFDVSGNGYDPVGVITHNGLEIEPIEHKNIINLGEASALTASATTVYDDAKKEWQRVSGDPTEVALLVFSKKIGFSKEALLLEKPLALDVPFSSQTKYHGSIHKVGNNYSFFVAGAPEAVLQKVNCFLIDGNKCDFGEKEKENIKNVVKTFSDQGLRVITIAVGENVSLDDAVANRSDLCLVGVIGIEDGLRPEVKDSVVLAGNAGIRVVMITGDHVDTAKAIAREAGIYKDGDGVITGDDLVSKNKKDLISNLKNVSVFARVTPEHKLQIIDLYRNRGDIVAMTGDGVNDALSLAAADLGVSMGKNGTEVAKEASDIVLLDDNFGNIVVAVEEGRSIYQTIKKVILYLFSTSLGEIFAITGAILLTFPLPVLPSQIIWLNFVTDGFLVVALAMEPKSLGLLGKRKKGGVALLDKDMYFRITIMALVMMIGTLFVFDMYSDNYAKATTMSLTVLAVFQWFNAWNCRSHKYSVFAKNLFSNMYLVWATVMVVVLQTFAVYSPFLQKVLKTVPLNASDWLMVVGVSVSILFVEEIRKLIRNFSK